MYKSEFQGRIQNHQAAAEPYPLFTLSIEPLRDEVRTGTLYYRPLADLNQSRQLLAPLYWNHATPTAPLAPTLAQQTPAIDTISLRIEASEQLSAAARSLLFVERSARYLLLQNVEQSLEDAEEAVRLDSLSLWAVLQRGVARERLYRLNAPDKMSADDLLPILRDFQTAIRIAPDCAFAHYNYACILSAAGKNVSADPAPAIAAYTEAIRLDPQVGEFYFNRALLLLQTVSQDPAPSAVGRNVSADTAPVRSQALSDLSRAGELGIPQAYNLIKRTTQP
jgi:tetratricopeptide (TPR) repeat protein